MQAAELVALARLCYLDLQEAAGGGESLQSEIGGGDDVPPEQRFPPGAVTVWWKGEGVQGEPARDRLERTASLLSGAPDDDDLAQAYVEAGRLAGEATGHVIRVDAWRLEVNEDWQQQGHAMYAVLQRGAGGLDTLLAQIGNVRRAARRHRSEG